MTWWFNLITRQVEEGPGAPNSERLGPYETKLQAELALEKARLRNEKWAKEDEQWDGANE